MTAEESSKQIFLKELELISSKDREICRAPRIAHDFPIIVLQKEDQEDLELAPLCPKVFRFENSKMHLFNRLSQCKGENDYVILYDTENMEEVTLFFKNTNIRESDEFKVHMYPIDNETRIRFIFANSENIFQTEWIKAKPRIKRKLEEGRNKANSDDRNSTPSQDSSPLADLETSENLSEPKLVKIFLRPNHGHPYYPPKGSVMSLSSDSFLKVTITLLGPPLPDTSQCKIIWGKNPSDSTIVSNKVEFSAPTGFPGEFVDISLDIDGIISESAVFQYDEVGNGIFSPNSDSDRKSSLYRIVS